MCVCGEVNVYLYFGELIVWSWCDWHEVFHVYDTDIIRHSRTSSRENGHKDVDK